MRRSARAGDLWRIAEGAAPFGLTTSPAVSDVGKRGQAPFLRSTRRAPGSGIPPLFSAEKEPDLFSHNGVVYRETECRTILNRSSISDYTLNCYTGCAHACAYCYARFMQRFHPHAEPWGAFVDVKVNAVETLRRQLRRAVPGTVFMSSACDGWQPVEKERRLTRQCCELLLDAGFQVNILTKSELVLRDFDLFAGRRVRVSVTVATSDERLRKLWEPRASSVEARFHVLAEARRAGIGTGIMFAPLLPFLSDTPESLAEMFKRAADLYPDELWVDALNARPKVWPSVADLLRRQFPGLFDRYRRILFSPADRESYISELRARVGEAAGRFGIRDRLTICF